jgi:hypothetical protein
LRQRDLHLAARMDKLPEAIGQLLGCPASGAIERLLDASTFASVPLSALEPLLQIRDMRIVSKTAAALASELKGDDVSYDHCCRTALIYAVARMDAHVFTALRAAASKDDSWARHHYLYGLILAAGGNIDRARWEFDMALQREPYEDARIQIRQAIALIDPA